MLFRYSQKEIKVKVTKKKKKKKKKNKKKKKKNANRLIAGKPHILFFFLTKFKFQSAGVTLKIKSRSPKSNKTSNWLKR